MATCAPVGVVTTTVFFPSFPSAETRASFRPPDSWQGGEVTRGPSVPCPPAEGHWPTMLNVQGSSGPAPQAQPSHPDAGSGGCARKAASRTAVSHVCSLCQASWVGLGRSPGLSHAKLTSHTWQLWTSRLTFLCLHVLIFIYLFFSTN